MSTDLLSERALIDDAQRQGLLPTNARAVWCDEAAPSWTITVLSFLGAQLVVLPFLGFLFLLSSEFFFKAPGAFVAAALLIGGATVVLRTRPGMFVEQLCFSALMAGLVMVVVGFEGPMDNAKLLFMVVLMLAVAWFVRVGWVQRLLGVGATLAALLVMLWPQGLLGSADEWAQWERRMAAFPMPFNAVLLALGWAAWVVYERRSTSRPWAGTLHALADGVGVALLAAAAWSSTNHFVLLAGLQGSAKGSADVAAAGMARIFTLGWPALLQMALVLGGAAWLLAHWRLRNVLARRELALLALVYAVLLVACLVIPEVGIVALIGTLALGSGRRLMFGLALAALLAQLSSFYYALAWPLVHKAALLAGVGAALGLALILLRAPKAVASAAHTAAATPEPVAGRRWMAPILIAAGACLALGIVHFDVQEKEEVIAHGQKIYIPLAPRDPRSLMQGDYMALNFAIPPQVHEQLNANDQLGAARHAQVVATVDARGVATVNRLAQPGQPLGASERLLPLKRLTRDWVVVTDAFHFPEGQGEPFAQARHGEFRVLPDGRALLVGLADEQLRPIAPAPRTPAGGTP